MERSHDRHLGYFRPGSLVDRGHQGGRDLRHFGAANTRNDLVGTPCRSPYAKPYWAQSRWPVRPAAVPYGRHKVGIEGRDRPPDSACCRVLVSPSNFGDHGIHCFRGDPLRTPGQHVWRYDAPSTHRFPGVSFVRSRRCLHWHLRNRAGWLGIGIHLPTSWWTAIFRSDDFL